MAERQRYRVMSNCSYPIQCGNKRKTILTSLIHPAELWHRFLICTVCVLVCVGFFWEYLLYIYPLVCQKPVVFGGWIFLSEIVWPACSEYLSWTKSPHTLELSSCSWSTPSLTDFNLYFSGSQRTWHCVMAFQGNGSVWLHNQCIKTWFSNSVGW